MKKGLGREVFSFNGGLTSDSHAISAIAHTLKKPKLRNRCATPRPGVQ
jgi:hypothetical protein